MMHLKVSKLLIFNLLFLVNLYSLDVLSTTQEKILDLTNDKILKDSAKLEKDWINPIVYTFSYTKNNEDQLSKISTLSINQPIFRSGGIYYAIKYASNLKNYSTLSLKLQKKELIAQTLNMVYNIKKLDIQIKQQKLLLKNANLDLKNKNESVFNGLLDISFLNNAIISKNKTKLSLVNLQYQKAKLVNDLKILSDMDYKSIKLPKLKLLDKKVFKQNNMNISKAKLDMSNKDYLKGMTNARYLPSVNLKYNKTYNHINENDSYNYGFNVVIPIDFKGLSDSASSKIEYLKSKEQARLDIKKEEMFFQNKLLVLEYIKSKLKLTAQNIHSYNKLIEQTKQLVDAQLKSKDDLYVLQNSKNIEVLNMNIYKIDEQIQLLDLYKRVSID